jgi:hypothetical protein
VGILEGRLIPDGILVGTLPESTAANALEMAVPTSPPVLLADAPNKPKTAFSICCVIDEILDDYNYEIINIKYK